MRRSTDKWTFPIACQDLENRAKMETVLKDSCPSLPGSCKGATYSMTFSNATLKDFVAKGMIHNHRDYPPKRVQIGKFLFFYNHYSIKIKSTIPVKTLHWKQFQWWQVKSLRQKVLNKDQIRTRFLKNRYWIRTKIFRSKEK